MAKVVSSIPAVSSKGSTRFDSGIKKRFLFENVEKIEEAVYELINVNMLDYSPFEKICERGVKATLTRPGILNIYDLVDFFNGLTSKGVHYDFAEYKDNVSANGLSISEEDSLFSGPLHAIREKKKKQCSCISPGNLYIGVSAEGDIFPCHRFVGYKDTRLGNISKGFNREKWLEKYAKVHIFNSTVCSTCWIRYLCGGMCAPTNYYLCSHLVLTQNVHPEPVHCRLKKIVFEEAMVLYARLSQEYHETKEEIQRERFHSTRC
ncbi:MAG: SPASM domain-containing protein [Candidatus Aminicenantes bacterium]|nr:SPASM domain-containing protein [Candidatus Aminicenantes bacterium]NIM83219.1 SPASM domain-containing protein [Candidatus Aminicenantes bacterium]NIN24323.1 SPASM domain-containing protein [Candidatus Aminicenantes bacterium]NIN48082.1 SPASM domain-containing protein [Candidatus Aminicenantes bacterium]NIN90983.1 SPASM domain-containing protein [Candidatus Aminicenantes bacterium]